MSEFAYLALLKDIIENGEDRPDRTGSGVKSVFGRCIRFDLSKGFPLLTTKKMSFRSVASELAWFVEGSTDERRLAEILHGTTDLSKKTIWTDNANSPYWTNRQLKKTIGDCGRIYGKQWTQWQGKDLNQIENVIKSIKTDPYSRRHVVTAWNPAELELMALPPCHILFQFYVSKSGKLSCHLFMRSVDVPLGLPYNIASYALLTHLVAYACELDVGELLISMTDAHIYQNQVELAKVQIERIPFDSPKLIIGDDLETIDDVTIEGYQFHPALKYPFSV